MSVLSILLAPFARRFIAGTRSDQAVAAALRMNAKGIQAIIDFLGEDVRSPQDVESAVLEYEQVLAQIGERRVRASISVKASQMGILLSQELCENNLRRLAKKAAAVGSFVWMDMEGSALTQKTIEAFEALRSESANCGLCLQAYLVRTGADIERLSKKEFHVRLCKGAYKEPPEISFTGRPAVEGNFRILASKLIDAIPRRVHPAMATHDPLLISDLKKILHQRQATPTQVEFQMLYGIQNTLLVSLAQEGFPASVYIPYGRAWLPYFTRRLRERRENWLFLLKNLHKS